MATIQENNKRINNLGYKLVEDLARNAKVTIDNGRIDITGLSLVTLPLSLGYWLINPDEYDLDWLTRFMTDEYAD